MPVHSPVTSLRQVGRLQFRAGVRLQRLDRPLAQHHAQAERHVGAGQLLLHRARQHERQALPAVRRGRAEPGPATLDITRIGVGETGRQGDDVVGQPRAGLVAGGVQRREDVLRQLRRLAENGVDQVGRRAVEPRQRGEAGRGRRRCRGRSAARRAGRCRSWGGLHGQASGYSRARRRGKVTPAAGRPRRRGRSPQRSRGRSRPSSDRRRCRCGSSAAASPG